MSKYSNICKVCYDNEATDTYTSMIGEEIPVCSVCKKLLEEEKANLLAVKKLMKKRG